MMYGGVADRILKLQMKRSALSRAQAGCSATLGGPLGVEKYNEGHLELQ